MSRSLGGTSLTTRSPIRNSPLEISSSPAIIRRLVVLPQPDGPTRTMNSPSPISRLRSFTAWKSPYILLTLSNVTVAMVQPPLPADHRGPMHPAAEAERGRAPYEDGSGSGHRRRWPGPNARREKGGGRDRRPSSSPTADYPAADPAVVRIWRAFAA